MRNVELFIRDVGFWWQSLHRFQKAGYIIIAIVIVMILANLFLTKND